MQRCNLFVSSALVRYLDRQFAEVSCLFHRGERLAGLGECEYTIDHRFQPVLDDCPVHRFKVCFRSDINALDI